MNPVNLPPRSALDCGGWRVVGRLLEAPEEGSDSFDYFPLDGGRCALSVFAVSGRNAGSLQSGIQASLRACCDGRRAIPEAMKRLNESLIQLLSEHCRVGTIFYGEFDATRGSIKYSNALQAYPILRHRDGSLDELKALGPLMGLFPDAVYTVTEQPIEPGDSLLLYSECGIEPALDPCRIGFASDRLRPIWQRVGGAAAERAVAAVLTEIEAFWNGAAIGKLDTLRIETEVLQMEVATRHRVRKCATPFVVLGSREGS